MLLTYTQELVKYIPWLKGLHKFDEEFDMPDRPYLKELLKENIDSLLKLKYMQLIEAVKTASYLFSPHLKILVEELTWVVGDRESHYLHLFEMIKKEDYPISPLFVVNSKLKKKDVELYNALRFVWDKPTSAITMGIRKGYLLTNLNIANSSSYRVAAWWIQKGMKIDYYFCKYAQDVRILQLVPSNKFIYRGPIRNTNLPCILYLLNEGFKIDVQTYDNIAARGNMETIRFMKRCFDDVKNKGSGYTPDAGCFLENTIDVWREMVIKEDYSKLNYVFRSSAIRRAVERGPEHIDFLLEMGEEREQFEHKFIFASPATIDHLLKVGVKMDSKQKIWNNYLTNETIDYLAEKGWIWSEEHLRDTKVLADREAATRIDERIRYHLSK